MSGPRFKEKKVIGHFGAKDLGNSRQSRWGGGAPPTAGGESNKREDMKHAQLREYIDISQREEGVSVRVPGVGVRREREVRGGGEM